MLLNQNHIEKIGYLEYVVYLLKNNYDSWDLRTIGPLLLHSRIVALHRRRLLIDLSSETGALYTLVGLRKRLKTKDYGFRASGS